MVRMDSYYYSNFNQDLFENSRVHNQNSLPIFNKSYIS